MGKTRDGKPFQTDLRCEETQNNVGQGGLRMKRRSSRGERECQR